VPDTPLILRHWHVRPGDGVREGQLLAEVETRMAIVEVPAQRDGVVERLLVAEGDEIAPDQELAVWRDG
jgi:pyruvate/2-oxoglutarate dehydrogenase complex dihydrolipoamide acyltransferase (E2) component